MTVAVVTLLVVGVVLLVVMLMVTLGHVRRFARARVVMTSDVDTATARLRALAAARPHRGPVDGREGS